MDEETAATELKRVLEYYDDELARLRRTAKWSILFAIGTVVFLGAAIWVK